MMGTWTESIRWRPFQRFRVIHMSANCHTPRRYSLQFLFAAALSAVLALGLTGCATHRPSPYGTQAQTVYTQVAAGHGYTCALVNDGTVQCWGANDAGQLGNGSISVSGAPVTVTGLKNVTAISAGNDHTCALLRDSTVQCWGTNDRGQLGNGTTTEGSTPIPVTVTGLKDVIAISAGLANTCALLSNGTVQCWGLNNFGQLGTTTNSSISVIIMGLKSTFAISSIPVPVTGLKDAIAVSTGGLHTCAILNGGTVQCWGSNDFGELGNGTTSKNGTPVPVTVTDIKDATAISTGYDHTCALLNGGTVQCWGNNMSGELGDGTTANRSTPATVTRLKDVIAISAGLGNTCALLSNGTVQCWGSNGFGALGEGTTVIGRSAPVTVRGLKDVTAISTGPTLHTCALLNDGSIQCWGNNSAAQLGDGTDIDRRTPVSVIPPRR